MVGKVKSLHLCQVKNNHLRCSIPASWLKFNDTKKLLPKDIIIGQEIAKEALEFGILCSAHGQNVYVRGLNGTGRLAMIKQMFNELSPKARCQQDRCYVHNFSNPERPRLLSLPAGKARAFREEILKLAAYVKNELQDALNSDHLLARRSAIQEEATKKIEAIKQPIEESMAKANLALVALKSGNTSQQAIFPVVNGQAVTPEQFYQLIQEGKIEEEFKKQFEENVNFFQKQLHAISRDMNKILEDASDNVLELNEVETKQLLNNFAEKIKTKFCVGNCESYYGEGEGKNIEKFIDEIIQDVIENQIINHSQSKNNIDLYDVNIIVEHGKSNDAPVIIENNPNLINLLGTIDANWTHEGPKQLDYRGIHAGSLLRADGGYLILNVTDILSEQGAWRSLIRTLRSGFLEIVPSEIGWLGSYNILKPEPIKLDVRVILIGDARDYYLLDNNDPDFSDLFKVLADFDSEIPRDKQGVKQYAQVLVNIIHEEKLPDFNKQAVIAIIEHGARIVSRKEKLTAKFGRVADIMREAAFLATKRAEKNKLKQYLVEREDVISAVKRTKQRASLPSKKFQDLLNNGTINIQTSGSVVGQINGLAVINAGPITYGFPSRITCTIGPGQAGLINIEGQSSMSGSIHTKGFHIIGGLLRHVLKTEHPLAFTASIAFEQSYGGIDGDSASGAETVCLFSALTGIPIRQSIAMTGAIDQHGKIQAIGGVNEKIEGFYDACFSRGLTKEQGVIIPSANQGDLMLREDIVKACQAGEFFIYSVANIQQALEIATFIPAGEIKADKCTKDSMIYLAREQLKVYWQRSLKSPTAKSQEALKDNPKVEKI